MKSYTLDLCDTPLFCYENKYNILYSIVSIVWTICRIIWQR